IVVQVHLDLAVALGDELGDRLEEPGLVLLAGVEEGVARRSSVRVAEAREARVLLAPAGDARARLVHRRLVERVMPGRRVLAVHRLVVVAHAEEEVPRPVVLGRALPRAIGDPRAEPQMELLTADLAERPRKAPQIDLPEPHRLPFGFFPSST